MATLNLNGVDTPVAAGDTVILRDGSEHVVSSIERLKGTNTYPVWVKIGHRYAFWYTEIGFRWDGQPSDYDIMAVRHAQDKCEFKPGQELTFMQVAQWIDTHGDKTGLQFFSNLYDEWIECTPSHVVSRGIAYRVEPQKMRAINGREYPAPQADVLVRGARYWTIRLGHEPAVTRCEWGDDIIDHNLLKRGFVHRTEGAARAHFDAIVGANDD
jgi:hypothetical protein